MLRMAGAVVLAALAIAGVGGPAVRIVMAVVAAVLGVTSLTGFCLVYQITHFRTLHRGGAKSAGLLGRQRRGSPPPALAPVGERRHPGSHRWPKERRARPGWPRCGPPSNAGSARGGPQS